MLRIIRISIGLLMAAAVMITSACSPNKIGGDNHSSEIYYSFTDYLGTKITLDKKPQRVAVLFSSFADVWQSAGGNTDITVGESVERGFADKTAVLADGGAGKVINNEELINAEPDFVICSADIAAQVKSAELLNDSGIPAAAFHVETFEEYLGMLKICTDITGDSAAYEKNGIEVKERIQKLMSENDGQPLKKNILFIRAGSGYSSTKAKTADNNFVCSMLDELETYNIAQKAPILLDGLSLEEVIDADPDYIFISTMGDEDAAKKYMNSVLSDKTWQSLTAIKNGNYTYLPKELFQFKPNSKWDKAYEYLIDIIYG